MDRAVWAIHVSAESRIKYDEYHACFEVGPFASIDEAEDWAGRNVRSGTWSSYQLMSPNLFCERFPDGRAVIEDPGAAGEGTPP